MQRLGASVSVWLIATAFGCAGGGETAEADATTESDAIAEVTKRAFLTDDHHTGDLGGPAGADALCAADPRAPSGADFKALLAGGGRRACGAPGCPSGDGQADWVLAPGTTYQRLDGEVLFTTDADALVTDYPTPRSLEEAINFWSGLHEDWATHDESCDGWATDAGETRGRVGWAEGTDEGWIQGGGLGCDSRLPLVCVEQ